MRFLYEKDEIIHAACENCERELKFRKYQLSEVKKGIECFCGTYSDDIKGLPNYDEIELAKKEYTKPIKPVVNSVRYLDIPKCPTCGSENISKISLTSKAVGGAMLGIFSSNVRNTFKCNQCGYKW